MSDTACDAIKLPPGDPAGAKFVPLHCHSHFSVLDGLNSPKEMAIRAVELGHSALAITDHGSCGGVFHFQSECKAVGIKPILGMEAYVVDNVIEHNKDEKKRHATLWATSLEGYKNLIILSTKGHVEGFYSKPRISIEDIGRHRQGLMLGSACVKGLICDRVLNGDRDGAVATAARMKEMFGDDFYCEVMFHKYNGALSDKEAKFKEAMLETLKIADQLGIKSILTYDSHYCRSDEAFYHDVLLSVQTKNTIKNPNRFSFGSNDFYMKPYSELVELCGGRMDLLENTLEVAAKVSSEDFIRKSDPKLPDFPLPPGVSSDEEYLKALISEGMITRGVSDKPGYQERMMTELEVIVKCKYVKYFLILWDVVTYARRNGIRVGPGRGSGAASLCLYCLGITQLDPIKHDLMFARFLSADRVGPPDVDIDFTDLKQEEMFNYVARKYGQDHVTRIGTYTVPRIKEAIRRSAKALDIGNDWDESAKQGKWQSGPNTMEIAAMISKCIPDDPKLTMADILKTNEVRVLTEKYPQLFDVAKKLQGTVVAAGIHPAGIIVCSERVADLVPLRLSNDVVCTQFDMKEIEPIGLLKFDFLGLKMLRVEDECIKLVKKSKDEDIDIDALEPNDPETFGLLNQGKVEGIFQFESGEGRYGISGLLKEIHVDSFNDIMVTTALYRPGPLGAKIHEDYRDYKHHKRTIKYVHPMMKDLLHDTFGLMVYQEQVMLIAGKMAGFPNNRVDYFRKAIGKKDDNLMQTLRGEFVSGCIKNGVDTESANKIFDMCRYFSKYGFNKAHAASYGFLSYQCAFLKTHFPVEYMCALMSANASDDDKRVLYERATERMGIILLPHHINKSKTDYTVEGSRSIRRPLSSLKGLGDAAVNAVVSGQPYADLQDFVNKVNHQAVNIKVFGILVGAKSMESFGMTANQLVEGFETMRVKVKKVLKQKAKQAAFGEQDMFSCDI